MICNYLTVPHDEAAASNSAIALLLLASRQVVSVSSLSGSGTRCLELVDLRGLLGFHDLGRSVAVMSRNLALLGSSLHFWKAHLEGMKKTIGNELKSNWSN